MSAARSAIRQVTDVAGMLTAAARWPVFSRTSQRMVGDLARQGLRPDTVIDVGANRGQFAVAALQTWPACTVHSFEPLPSMADHLNGLVTRYSGRYRVTPSAVGSEPGSATLNVNRHHQSSSLLALDRRHRAAFPDATPTDTVDVPVTTLDEELSSDGLAGRSLLKVDVQGFEREVLLGAARVLGDFDHVILEASFQPMYADEWTFRDIEAFLRDRGFRFVRPVGSLRDPATGEYLQIDALFEPNPAE